MPIAPDVGDGHRQVDTVALLRSRIRSVELTGPVFPVGERKPPKN